MHVNPGREARTGFVLKFRWGPVTDFLHWQDGLDAFEWIEIHYGNDKWEEMIIAVYGQTLNITDKVFKFWS